MNNYRMLQYGALTLCLLSYASIHSAQISTSNSENQQQKVRIELFTLLEHGDLDAPDTQNKIQSLLQQHPPLRTEFLLALTKDAVTPHHSKWKPHGVLLEYCMQPPHTDEELELLMRCKKLMQYEQEQANKKIRELKDANRTCALICTQLSHLLAATETKTNDDKQDVDALIAQYSFPRELFEGSARTNNETEHMHCYEGTEIFLRRIHTLLISDECTSGVCTHPMHTLKLDICEQNK